MPRIRFTQNLQRHVACPEAMVPGETVREALDAYFADRPATRGYVLDDQGILRAHMAIFVAGRPVVDRSGLSETVGPDDAIDVMQALSGG